MVKDTSGSPGGSGRAIRDSRFTIHHFPARLLAVQATLAALLAPWYSVYGLTIEWSSAWILPLAQVGLAGAWLYYRRYADHPTKFIFTDVIMATSLILLLTNIASPAQYLALALHRPLIDDWLMRADAAFGVDVAALATWTRAHPTIASLLSSCYASLLPQFLMPMIVLGLGDRDRTGLWEYVFHFHFCLVITVAALAVFPAECPYTHMGFTPTIDQSRVIRHIAALRQGTFHHINFGDLDGLVSMPSFHAAGALMVTWVLRRRRKLFCTLAVVNTGLIAATFVSGVHYFVDVLGAVVLFAASLVTYRALTRERGVAPIVAAAGAWMSPRWLRAAHTSPD